jgi:serine protease Do
LTPDISRQFNLGQEKGVIIAEVEPDSKGEKAGILAGDLIKEINHVEITSTETYRLLIEKIKPGESLNFFIRRMNTGYIVIKVEK